MWRLIGSISTPTYNAVPLLAKLIGVEPNQQTQLRVTALYLDGPWD